jgi:hypothetical protein
MQVVAPALQDIPEKGIRELGASYLLMVTNQFYRQLEPPPGR